ncbi:MAG: 2-amino-4-hydroxy-6-hydroxymethyldihydropteridine diphosphokinase [Pseudomonadales bacterium]
MVRCFISLGSNLEQPLAQVNRAAEELASLPESALISLSPWYQSAAIGPGEQPDYINGVAELHSIKKPLELLVLLQDIETKHQRQRLERWGPRTLDLDLLLYGNEIITEPTLTIPHPRMLERNFVLLPLFDIAPELKLPDGTSLKLRRDQCSPDGLRLVDPHSSPTIAPTRSPQS